MSKFANHFIINALFYAIFSLFSFIYPIYSDTKSFEDMDILMQKGLSENKDTIKKLAWNLTEQERMTMILKYRKDNFFSFILNVTLGFGSGSYIQGNLPGGIAGTFTGLGFLGSITGGAIFLMENPKKTFFEIPAGWFIGAAVSGVLYAMAEVLLPVFFTKQYNDMLYDALMIKENITFLLIPYENKISGVRVNDGAMAMISYRF